MYVVCFEFILSPVGDDILEEVRGGGAQFLSAGFGCCILEVVR